MSYNNQLPTAIFNLGKADYEYAPIIFGEPPGLFDSINKQYPIITMLFNSQKSLDWTEDEFFFASHVADFEKADKRSYDLMIKTLSWQWEGDSIASRSIMGVLGPVISSSEAKRTYERIVDNENLHAVTYSEIVRLSFKDPTDVMNEILSVREAHSRLKTISRVIFEAYEFACWWALERIRNPNLKPTQEMYNKIFLFLVALLCLERIQFMNSFAITFAFGSMGRFIEIAKAVQRICQDEFQVHVQMGVEVLKQLIQTPMGKQAFVECKEAVKYLIIELHQVESEWNEYAFPSTSDRLGPLNGKMMQQFTDFSATSVASFFELEREVGFNIIKENPLVYFDEWVKVGSMQASPQEQQNAQYRFDIVKRNDQGIIYDFDLPFTIPNRV